MSERREIHDQPVVIHLVTNRGHLSSPPIEWTERNRSRVEHTFDLKHECFINGYVVTHPDGVIFFQEMGQMRRMTPGPFTIGANINDSCADPECTKCNPLS
jgi:hypothetical protein